MVDPLRSCDVVVVGAGNAALSAALSARESGSSVVVLERAPKRLHGGNSRFTMAAMRFAYAGFGDLLEVAPGLADDPLARTSDFGAYEEAAFLADLDRTSGGRCDAGLADALVADSRPTLRWLGSKGVRFVPLYEGQSYEVEGRRRFWGGLTLQAENGGPGLVSRLRRAVCRAGIPVHASTRATALRRRSGRITGIAAETPDGPVTYRAKAVVLACGGFEADPQWRGLHLGEPWRGAKVRGTRFNTGDGIRMALAVGADRAGDWSGCHAVQWDLRAPPHGDLRVRHEFQKHSYPLGILVNARGERFVDEGADFRNFTYARYGGAVLAQPGGFAWQIFDATVLDLLRPEYRADHATRIEAGSLEELAGRLEGVERDGFLATVAAYNAAVDRDTPFDPTRLDGRAACGLEVPRSNWANPLERPPFVAYAVTCGITFTFGGLAVDREGRVLDEKARPIPGLCAAGELLGGLFWGNYPGGAGLTAGAVFGRRAGRSAARWAAQT